MNDSNIPLEVYVGTNDYSLVSVPSYAVEATYNHKRMLEDSPNLASYSIQVHVDFANIVSASFFVGNLKFFVKFIDGAGNLSDTTNSIFMPFSVTIDMTAPHGTIDYVKGLGYIGSPEGLALYGVSRDYAFSSRDNQIVLTAEFWDSESGLAVSWNWYDIYINNLAGGEQTTWSRGWNNCPTIDIFDCGVTSVNNYVYRVVLFGANGTGIVSRLNTLNIIMDQMSPTIISFDVNLAKNVAKYESSSANFCQVQTFNITWTAWDNCWNSIFPQDFHNQSHQGIYKYSLFYQKKFGADPWSNWLTISDNIFPTTLNNFVLGYDYVRDNFSNGTIKILIQAVDFAGNVATRSFGPVFFDGDNQLNDQIDRMLASDKTDNDGLGSSPFDVSGPNYFDQTNVFVSFVMSANAQDLTQFSYLPLNNIPIDMQIRDSLGTPYRISSINIYSYYNRNNLPNILDVPNLRNVTIDVTVNLEDYVGTEDGKILGNIRLEINLVDGAGNQLDTFSNKPFQVTIDVTPPQGGISWNAADYGTIGSAFTYTNYGIMEGVLFSSNNENLRLTVNFDDTDSGLADVPYQFVFTKYGYDSFPSSANFDPSPVTRNFTSLNILNIRDLPDMDNNFIYIMETQVRNKVGFTKVLINKVILDTIPPVVSTFDISESNGSNYSASSRNFYPLQVVTMNWAASDGVFVNPLDDLIFNAHTTGKTHNGIKFCEMYYEKFGTINYISKNIIPDGTQEFIITPEYLLNQIKEGKVTIGINAYDFAGNKSNTVKIL
ncbi:MAG: hypothetical protein WC560_12830, partial [Syntrophales bacterium]